MSIILWLFPDPGSYKKARRLVRLVIGGTVLLLGMLLLVLPGPAFVVIPLGLAILAGEFVWARVLLRRAKYHINRIQEENKDSG
jgi:tellurite resistance protein TerC